MTVACLLAVWLVVRPAAAAAPLCDDRAASMLAPLPILDVPDASVDVSDHSESCDGWVSTDKAYQRGDCPSRVADSVHLDLVLPPATREVVPFLAEPIAFLDARTVEQSGVRCPLERPPRARV